MPAIASISKIAKKWATVTPGRSADYEAGVQDPDEDWEARTKAAEGIYEAELQAAMREKRFGKGVARAGTSKWKEKTLTKGVRNWGPGVADAEGDYAEGFAPIVAAIERTTLSPRGTKLSPQNFKRVEEMARAISAASKARR